MPLEVDSLLLGRYRIRAELARGGMGAVYLAYDENLSAEVAIKENLVVSPESERQFRREASLLANLRHPNLPRVLDHFVVVGQGQYLVMDFIGGEDVRQHLERAGGPLSEADAVQWGSQILEALTYMHERQPPIIHRDVKPGNVKITPEGRAILVDFGLAVVHRTDATTTAGAKALTPGYAPPEQYGLGRTDARTDIYGLAATLYNILTNQMPADSLERAVGEKQLIPIQQLNPGVSASVAKAIERALSIKPDERFASAREFRAALQSGAPTQIVTLPESTTATEAKPTSTKAETVIPPAMAPLTWWEQIRLAWKSWEFTRRQTIQTSGVRTLPAWEITEQSAFYRIALPHSLAQVKALLFSEFRGQIVNAVEREIVETAVEGRIITLTGFRGIGATEISRMICDRVRLHLRRQSVFVRVQQMEDQQILALLNEILFELKRRGAKTSWQVQRAIQKAYATLYKPKRATKKFAFKFQPPVQITMGSAVPGLGGSFGTQPMEVAYENEPATPPAAGTASEAFAAQSRVEVLIETLRELLEMLVAAKFRIILIVDHVRDMATIAPLRKFVHLSGVTTLLIAEHTVTEGQTLDFVHRNFYIPCLWDLPQRVMQEFGQTTDSQYPWAQMLPDFFDFLAQGLPKQLFAAVDEFYQDNPSPALLIPKERLKEIETSAQLARVIRNNRLFFNADNNLDYLQAADPLTKDRAKVAVYRTMHALLAIARTSTRTIPTAEVVELLMNHGIPFQEAQAVAVAQNIKRVLIPRQDTLANRLHTTYLSNLKQK